MLFKAIFTDGKNNILIFAAVNNQDDVETKAYNNLRYHHLHRTVLIDYTKDLYDIDSLTAYLTHHKFKFTDKIRNTSTDILNTISKLNDEKTKDNAKKIDKQIREKTESLTAFILDVLSPLNEVKSKYILKSIVDCDDEYPFVE